SNTLQFSERDEERRLEFCRDFKRIIENHLDDVWFTDEVHFQESWYSNSQNFRQWSGKNPHYHVEKMSYPKRTTVWTALNANDYTLMAVSGESYRNLIRNYFIPPYLRITGRFETYWIMQDGAAVHTARETTDFLRQEFGDRVISLHFPNCYNAGVAWAERSPDLNPLITSGGVPPKI
uniref:Tc1-like transposase DDE domain-containing protein n=1 Tax=Megaselia scalaris TaxID=36166 RepID=T1H4W2_MEGSC